MKTTLLRLAYFDLIAHNVDKYHIIMMCCKFTASSSINTVTIPTVYFNVLLIMEFNRPELNTISFDFFWNTKYDINNYIIIHTYCYKSRDGILFVEALYVLDVCMYLFCMLSKDLCKSSC